MAHPAFRYGIRSSSSSTTPEALEQLVGYGVRVTRQLPSVLDDRLVLVVQLEPVRVLSGIDQEPAEEGRADETVGAGRYRMGEELRAPDSQKWHHPGFERIPFHQGAKRNRRVTERPFHVRDASVGRDLFVVEAAGFRPGGPVREWLYSGHRNHLEAAGV
jgi:hypothetical protein